MIRFLVRRVAASVLVFFAIAVGLFTLVRLAPGDPVEMMVPPEVLGQGGEAYVEAIRARLGLDQPIIVQFWRWFTELLTGNLGFSYSNGLPVSDLLRERIGPTFLLMGTAMIVAIIIAVPAGVIAARRRNTVVDYSLSTVSVLAITIPSFFLGMMAIYIFSVQLQVLPSSGMHTSGRSDIGDLIRHMIMPGTLLTLTIAAPYFRYVRSGMLEELSSDYVRAVVAKGAGQGRATMHALRNSLIPLVTVLAVSIPELLGGAVVLETVFSWPGMGQLAVNAVNTRDYPVVIGFGLWVAFLVLLCNLLADILYTVTDPRVRTMQ